MKLFAYCLTVLTICSGASAASRPNIVLVMADDQGWGDMGYNGHPLLKTPHFDEAASAGLRFDRFYAAAPVCSPTRASVMTGRHPNRMGVFQWGYPMRPQEITIAEALKTVGYRTAHFGKWHLGSVRRSSPAHPGKNGFDKWLSAPNFFDNNPILSDAGQATPMRGESSIVTADAAITWMQECVKQEEAFLAVVWFGSPHGPHRAIERDRKLYEGQPKNVQNFLGEITGMDRAFGRIRSSLDAMGVREKTLLWYCSDNGALPRVGSTGGHRGHKGRVYEGGLLVPAFLEWPERVPEPRVTDVRCTTCDIYPTLLEMTGVTVPDQPPLDGESLLPLLDGKVETRSKPIGFWNYTAKGISTPSAKWMSELLDAQTAGRDLEAHPTSLRAGELPDPAISLDDFRGHAAWIHDDWKLHRIANKKGSVTLELYNLREDPKETHNMMADNVERTDALNGELSVWLQAVVDSLNGKDYSAK